MVNGTVGGMMTDCSEAEVNYIEQYRRHFNNFIDKFLSFTKNSAWTISCIKHTSAYLDECYDSDNFRVPHQSGVTIKTAVEDFIFKRKKIQKIDKVQWPDNTACAL